MTNDNSANWASLILNETSAENITKQYRLSPTEVTVIGRSPDCQIALDPHEFITVSRRHAEIKLVDASWQINDLGTTNGTLVNDCPINNPQQLESGDRITLGKKGPEFTFECLSLNATVMVQPTEMKIDPEPAKAEASTSKPENRPIETPKAEAANATIPSAKEVKPEAKTKKTTPASPGIKPEPANAPIVEKESIAEPQSEPKQEPVGEPTPKAKAKEESFVVSPATPRPNTPIASNSDKTLWNSISATEVCQIAENSQPVLALAFSPDGQILASAAKDKTIKLWNLADRGEIATLTGHKLAANALAFSLDGKTLASGGADKTIKLWNVDNRAEIASFSGHKLAINALAFSPDGKTLASGSKDKTIKLWNVVRQEETGTFAGHKLAIESLAFSPDGQTLASGSKDKTIKLWNVVTKEETTVLAGHKQGISDISFSPDGQIIASVGADQTIKLWNKDRLEIAAISLTALLRYATPSWQTGAIAISADGQTLAGIDDQNSIKLWQI